MFCLTMQWISWNKWMALQIWAKTASNEIIRVEKRIVIEIVI